MSSSDVRLLYQDPSSIWTFPVFALHLTASLTTSIQLTDVLLFLSACSIDISSPSITANKVPTKFDPANDICATSTWSISTTKKTIEKVVRTRTQMKIQSDSGALCFLPPFFLLCNGPFLLSWSFSSSLQCCARPYITCHGTKRSNPHDQCSQFLCHVLFFFFSLSLSGHQYMIPSMCSIIPRLFCPSTWSSFLPLLFRFMSNLAFYFPTFYVRASLVFPLFFIILFPPILAKTFKVPFPSTFFYPFRFSSYVRFFIILHERFIFTNRIFNIVAESLTDFFFIVFVSLSIRHSFLFSSEGCFLFPQTLSAFLFFCLFARTFSSIDCSSELYDILRSFPCFVWISWDWIILLIGCRRCLTLFLVR